MYNQLLKPLLFHLDPEDAHHFVLSATRAPLSTKFGRGLIRARYVVSDPRLAVDMCHLSFPNPVGLAAGFDKNCEAFPLLSSLGFGHIEVGTITAEPQPGNPRPRIFRFPKANALVNRMGFPSEGADAVCANLRAASVSRGEVVLGVNIGKSKVAEIDRAQEDYLSSFSKVAPYADYIVLNVSSPNTPELRKLQERDRLEELFRAIGSVNERKLPIFVKVSPDLSESELDDVIEVVLSSNISGIIATNTTIDKSSVEDAREVQGGLSGAPLRERSLRCIAAIWRRTNGGIPIIGVGGIFSANDALAAMTAGASLVQVYTGLIYVGPSIARSINRGLLAFLDREGVASLREIIGSKAHLTSHS